MGKTNQGGISQDRIERAARIYSSNQAAAEALGIVSGSFARLCRRYGIESPRERRERVRGYKKAGRHNKDRAPTGEYLPVEPPELLDDAPPGSDDDRPECVCGQPREPDEEFCGECNRARPVEHEDDGTIRNGHARVQALRDLEDLL